MSRTIAGASSRRLRRKRKVIDYNEDSLADVQEVAGRETSVKTEKRAKKMKKLKQEAGDVASLVKEMLLKPCIHPVKRNKHGRLRFKDHPEFTPNLAPYQVLQLGAFGGTYFRPIKSSVTNATYHNVHREFPKNWFEGLLEGQDRLTRAWSDYRKPINYFGVKCGGDLEMWEGSGWISAVDPYGWFQWYCRFFLGRRTTDDTRQIKRWAGVCSDKGRFRNQLIGKCARGGTSFDDDRISPVIRQTLLHWGYLLQEKDAKAYVKLKGLPSLKPSTRAFIDVATAGVPPGMRGTLPRGK